MIGQSIIVSLGEPWDFPHNPIKATIKKTVVVSIDAENGENIDEKILIKADKPFVHENIKSEYFIASPRYVGERISQLITKGELTIGMHRISELRANSDNPFTEKEIKGDDKSWGGIGSFKLCT